VHRGGCSAGGCHQHGGVVNLKAFFVASLQTALDLQIATPEDILKHVTPDILSQYLPRPLWARVFTACLGAPRVDATLVVETIGVPNLCEHVPAQLIWACIADIGNRSLGKPVSEEPIVLRPKSVSQGFAAPEPMPASSSKSGPQPLTAPPPDVIAKPANPPLAPAPKVGPSIPAPSVSPAGTGAQALSDIVAELEAESSRDEKPATPRTTTGRVPTQQRFRQSQTGIGSRVQPNATPPPEKGTGTRRPQADAKPPTLLTTRRGQTEAEESETETSVGKGDDWRTALAVEDEQLVDWQSADETLTVADDLDPPRKR
jgi:hypothetical protein